MLVLTNKVKRSRRRPLKCDFISGRDKSITRFAFLIDPISHYTPLTCPFCFQKTQALLKFWLTLGLLYVILVHLSTGSLSTKYELALHFPLQ